jgi:hypothetical protein
MPRRCRDHDLTKELHRSHRSRSFPAYLGPRRHRGPLASIREFDLEVHSGEARHPLAAFLRRPADPRYLANDSRSADVVATLRRM